jgi:hypothetical protein
MKLVSSSWGNTVRQWHTVLVEQKEHIHQLINTTLYLKIALVILREGGLSIKQFLIERTGHVYSEGTLVNE